MPLIKSKSKKAFEQNVKTEMGAGKPQDQALAVAYSIKRKNRKKMAAGGQAEDSPKATDVIPSPGGFGKIIIISKHKQDEQAQKMAEGGEVNESAKSERRPMPDERDKDSKMVSRNSGNKPPKDDHVSDDPTVKQAQKPSKTPLSRPKLVGSDAFSVRYKDEIDRDLHRMDSEPPESDRAQPPKRYDEEGAQRQGPSVPDMQKQHNNQRAAYERAVEHEYAQDMANANMKKVQSLARGGPVMQPEDSGIEMHERNEEARLMDSESPSMDEGSSDAKRRNEEGPNRQGPAIPDMEREHSNGRKSYASGGMIQPEPEADEEHHASIAAAIMSKKERQKRLDSDSDEDHMVMMAEGGRLPSDEISSHDSIYSDSSDQADLSRNADEDANEEDQLSFNALTKENYSESEGLRQLDSPMDSGQHGDDIDSDEHDMISKIRGKMKVKRAFE